MTNISQATAQFHGYNRSDASSLNWSRPCQRRSFFGQKTAKSHALDLFVEDYQASGWIWDNSLPVCQRAAQPNGGSCEVLLRISLRRRRIRLSSLTLVPNEKNAAPLATVSRITCRADPAFGTVLCKVHECGLPLSRAVR